MTAGWSMRWPARCRARSRWRRRRRRGRARAMSGSARRGRSTGCRRRSSRSTRAEVNDERIGCLLVGPGLGDIPQVLTLALTSQGAQGDRRRRDHAISAIPSGCSGQDAIITPHEGEFRQAVRRDRRAQSRSARSRRRGGRGAVVVYKGPGHAGRVARRTARLRAAGAGLAGERRDRATCSPA